MLSKEYLSLMLYTVKSNIIRVLAIYIFFVITSCDSSDTSGPWKLENNPSGKVSVMNDAIGALNRELYFIDDATFLTKSRYEESENMLTLNMVMPKKAYDTLKEVLDLAIATTPGADDLQGLLDVVSKNKIGPDHELVRKGCVIGGEINSAIRATGEVPVYTIKVIYDYNGLATSTAVFSSTNCS